MITVEQSRMNALKSVEELTFAEQAKMIAKTEEEIRNRDYMSLEDFKNYMERKYLILG